jgi:hypothetical protein
MIMSKDSLLPEWLKSALVLNWSQPSQGPANTEAPEATPQRANRSKPSVSLLIFEPTFTLYERILTFAKSNNWETVLQDPFLLVEMAFGAWYERLDINAWDVTNLCSDIEKVCLVFVLPMMLLAFFSYPSIFLFRKHFKTPGILIWDLRTHMWSTSMRCMLSLKALCMS